MQRLVATRPEAAIHRTLVAPLDASIMGATRGRLNLEAGAVPVVVLTSTGARSGQPRETPLIYLDFSRNSVFASVVYVKGALPQ